MSELEAQNPVEAGSGPPGKAAGAGLDYRQAQRPTEMLSPRHMPDSGAASVAEELAGALKGFANKASDLGTKLNVQVGSQAGAQAGLDPGFQPKTGLAAITASGAAYNAAAAVSFKAQSETHAITSIEAA